MKLKQIASIFSLLILLLSACSEEETPSCTVSIQVLFPEGYTNLPFDGVSVTLTNHAGGTTYIAPCSPTGVATLVVEPGEYTASTHHQTATGLVFNGRTESVLLASNGDTSPQMIKLTLIHAQTHALVIKEIYYDGCMGREDDGYQDDQYITLYNNSKETVYLDGLCVAMIESCDANPSPWLQRDPTLQRIPLDYISWQFPGKGQEYPLLPGTETTIACNAVDHTGGEYQHLNSINLSAADWGTYNEKLRNVITPSVKVMNMLLRVGTSNKYSLSMWGPTLILFTLPVPDAQAYIQNPDNRERQPSEWSNANELFLMIDKEWVIDCVESGFNWEDQPLKRVPADLDAAAICIGGMGYSGKSLLRKKNVSSDGHTTYQDTNNSAQDFEISSPTLKR